MSTTKLLPFVTNAEWSQFDHGHQFPEGTEHKPVTGVTHAQADQYAKWLSSRTGKKYRLPTATELDEGTKKWLIDSDFFPTNEKLYQRYPLRSLPDSAGPGAIGVYPHNLVGCLFTWIHSDQADSGKPVAREFTLAELKIQHAELLKQQAELTKRAEEVATTIVKAENALKTLLDLGVVIK